MGDSQGTKVKKPQAAQSHLIKQPLIRTGLVGAHTGGAQPEVHSGTRWW